MKTNISKQLVALSLAIQSLFLGLPLTALPLLYSQQAAAQVPVNPAPTLKLSDPLPANLFVELSKAINPSVVNISTTQVGGLQRQRDPMMELFEQFYGVPMRPRNNKPRPLALGTGFIIRSDGLIVTNAHVVAGADGIQVQINEGSEKKYDAKLIGSDDRTDIALIKIEAEGKLPAVSLGNSKETQVGEWVLAFGNPFNLGHTVTKGIISSIGREIREINKIPLLQTDASINPGNSGGPLVNSKGQVIGVNNAINAAAQGIGFAIPIDEVKRLIPDLETRGSIRKGYLGIGLGELDPASAQELGLGEDAGAVVTLVEPKSPAAMGGLRVYDIILEYNGKKVPGAREFTDMVQDTSIGSTAKLKVLRANKRITLQVKIGEKKEELARRRTNTSKAPKIAGQKVPHKLGFSVADLSEEMREQFSIPDQVNRPVISDVDRGSIADTAGLRVGDVILVVNNEEVNNAKDVVKNVKKGRNVLRLARGGNLFVVSFETR